MTNSLACQPINLVPLDASLIGVSQPMQQLRARIARIARSPIPVLVHGPTGAGKELVARAIHAASQRPGAFIPFNVSAIPDAMFADALFGHVRGAFTNAIAATPGYLHEAHRGTVFLDEIGGLSLANQMTLLRVLETQTYRWIGATKEQHSDFRVISATNENLVDRVRLKGFRDDLLYRLRGVTIEVPSLRERLEDIPFLVRHFTTMTAGPRGQLAFTPAAIRALQAYDWPGNIRELRHLIATLGYLSDTTVVDAPAVAAAIQACVSDDQCDRVVHATVAKRADLLAVMQHYGNDLTAVAAHYGRARATVYRWLQAHGIPTPARRSGRRQGERRPPFALKDLVEGQE